MLEKTIKAVIVKKFNDWCSTLPEDLQKKVANNTIITGGALVSLMQNEKPKDFDLYFTNKETTLAVAKYYCKKFNEKHKNHKNKLGYKTQAIAIDYSMIKKEGDTLTILDPDLINELDGKNIFNIISEIQEATVDNYRGMSRMLANITPDRIKIYIKSDGIVGEIPSQEFEDADEIPEEILEEQAEGEKYFPVFMSSNAITLSDKIQIIVRFYGAPAEIHENFDFTHTKAWWWSNGNQLHIPKEVYECVMNKTLIYSGSLYPLCSLFRMRKFINRGWTINAGQIVKMAFQVSNLDLTNIDILEDQLIGVDSLYFIALVDQLRKQQENKDFQITEGYVVSVINKIFG